MKMKYEAHEYFPLMLQRYGLPPRMIFDGYKEQVEGDFSHKCKEDG